MTLQELSEVLMVKRSNYFEQRAFGHGDIITYDKYNGKELCVTADDILPSGDGFVYTVQHENVIIQQV